MLLPFGGKKIFLNPELTPPEIMQLSDGKYRSFTKCWGNGIPNHAHPVQKCKCDNHAWIKAAKQITLQYIFNGVF